MRRSRKYIALSAHSLGERTPPRWRSRFVSGAFVLCFVTLTVRAFWVQGVNDELYRKQGDLRQVRDWTLHASRGRILDRDGRPLAISTPARAATIHPVDASTQPVGRRIYSARVAREVRTMMERVVSKDGTAPQAAVSGYTVAGKTGTAYRRTSKGYDRQQYRASFIGIVPARMPRVVIAVSIDRPRRGSHFGGAVAGPPFAAIAQDAMRALDVAPDQAIAADTLPE